jgi:hypothetical protein
MAINVEKYSPPQIFPQMFAEIYPKHFFSLCALYIKTTYI